MKRLILCLTLFALMIPGIGNAGEPRNWGYDWEAIITDIEEFKITTPLFIAEQAVGDADIAGYGQIWVKNTAPNELWFTDDGGTDHQLGAGGSGSGDITSVTAGTGLTGGGNSGDVTLAVDGVLEDLYTLGAAAADGEFIVATGAGAFAYETGATARTSLGLGSAATRAAEDTLTDGSNLPDGSAIKAYGDTNWVTDATSVNAAGAVMESDFNATTFLYATSDDTPEAKTPAEVRAILDLEAGTDFYSKSAEDTWRNNVSQTEMGYVDGVTSDIQTQINSKQATITGAATTIDDTDLTASRAVVSDASGKVAVATTTSTEIGYVNGVTSAIQTQIDNKQATGNYITALTGDVTASGPGSAAATIANDAVTYAKIQNVSATDKVLGRSTAGAGDVEEIACTSAGRALIDDADAAAQRTTLGLGSAATRAAEDTLTDGSNLPDGAAVKAYGDANWDNGDITEVVAGTGLTGGGASGSVTLAVDGVLEDLDTLGAAASDGQFIVATGAGAFGYESGSTARTSLGVGSGDSPTFTGLTISGSITEGGNDVPNSTDNLSFFAATTSAQLAGVLSNETGTGVAVFGTSPTLVTPTLGAATATTLDTGQGANELYDMDQNVLTTSAPTFATVDTGQGANELYDMDQNVLTTSSPTFAGLSVPDVTFDDTDHSPASVGELLYDNSVTGLTDGSLAWYDDDEVRYVLDSENQPVPMNLIQNSGFGVWSNSDTNKGLGSMNYDGGTNAGGGDTPDPGDTVTGDTSGATCKIIAITVASGSFAGTDAAGVITLGACTGRFQDNETASCTDGEDVTVNMPDSAAGVDLVQNGDFSVDTDPPPGWTATNATLTTEGSGQVGNCLQVASSGDNIAKAYQDITTEVGKLYKLALYFKKGTSDNGKYMIGITTDEDSIYDSGALTDAAWAAKSKVFTATATTTRITMQSTDATNTETSLFDEISLYEITPCSTSGVVGMDKWYFDGTLDVYRVHNDGGTYTHDGSFYAIETVSGAAADYIFWPYPLNTNASFYQRFAGRTVTYGMWVKTSEASHVRLSIYDGSYTYSSYHTGGGGWEWLSVTHSMSGSLSEVRFYAFHSIAGAIAYISQPQLSFGASLPEGGYMQPPGEVVWLDKAVDSAKFNNTGSWSDVSDTVLDLEADSEGMLPSGATALYGLSRCKDSGSASASLYFQVSPDITNFVYYFPPISGVTNDKYQATSLWWPLDSNGDYEYKINASGAGTLTIGEYQYLAVQVAP